MKELKPMLPMKDVKWIVIHCSYTKASQKCTVEDLDNFHQAKGWACCGYHWVIYQDGSIHPGRAEKFAGAHVRHYNQHAIGVCYIGGMDLLKDLKQAYPQAKIVGHRDFPRVAKTCPLFDVQKEYATLNANLKVVN